MEIREGYMPYLDIRHITALLERRPGIRSR